MSYRAAVYGLEHVGIPSGTARIKCDAEGCTARVEIGANRTLPPQWFFDGKAPPKWTRAGGEHDKRFDYCPEHKPTRQRSK